MEDQTSILRKIGDMVRRCSKVSAYRKDLLACIDENRITLQEVLDHEYFCTRLHPDPIDYEPVDEDDFLADCLVDSPVDSQMEYRVIRSIGNTSGLYELEKGSERMAAEIVSREPEPDVIVQLVAAGLVRECNTNHSTMIVMDLPAGHCSTFDEIKWRKTDEEKRLIISRLVAIIRSMDRLNIAHNDLREDGILVSEPDDRVTLIHFSKAQYKDRLFFVDRQHATRNDSPPELIENGVFDYDRMTMWSVGMIIKNSFGPIPPLARDLLDWIFAPFEQRIAICDFFDHPYFSTA